MIEFIDRLRDKTDINTLSPLTWAYVGDSVYELYIRTNLINNTKLKPHKLHIESIKYVKAKAQAEALQKLEEILTDEEKDIIRRGRNTKINHTAKNATLQDYMYATAFEALIGYLYLTKQEQRLETIFNKIIKT